MWCLGCSRDLRHGILNLSCLFIWDIEAPSKMTDKVVLGGLLRGFTAVMGGKGRVNFTHLLFVNDTFIFVMQTCLADILLAYLVWFNVYPGIKINFRKYEIIQVDEPTNIEDQAQTFIYNGTLACFCLLPTRT